MQENKEAYINHMLMNLNGTLQARTVHLKKPEEEAPESIKFGQFQNKKLKR